MQIGEISAKSKAILDEIERVIVGKRDKEELILAAFLAGGHVLLEDLPGTGKTMLAKSLGAAMGMDFNRIQCTPDLLPSDITGVHFYNQKSGDFEFRRGSVFANIILADEINRATPRTQSGLLEAMEEQQVTVDGNTMKVGEPFFVIATQNPIETVGTFPLPEAQLDRFMIKLSLGYPDDSYEKQLMLNVSKNGIDSVSHRAVNKVCDKDTFMEMQRDINAVEVDESIIGYIMDIVKRSRESNQLLSGVSTRGELALISMAKAYTALKGETFVTADTVKMLVPYVFAHRVSLSDPFMSDSKQRDIIAQIITKVEAPTEENI